MRDVSGCKGLRAHQAYDFFSFWAAWEAETGGEREIPFWSVVWPAAAVLSHHLLKGTINVENRTVLDLGCGGGAAAIAAALAGARHVTANDVDPVARYLTRLNAAANQVEIRTDGTDLLTGDAPLEVDVIFVGDLFYTKSEAGPMLDFLHRLRENGTLVIIADAERMFAPKSGVETLATATVEVDRELEGTYSRRVRILKLSDDSAVVFKG